MDGRISSQLGDLKVVIHQWDTHFPTIDSNVDVEVISPDGRRWSATIFTVENVRSLLKRWEETGEHGGGACFWCPDGLIVKELSEQSIHNALQILIDEGEFESALKELFGGSVD